jgi:putative transposase
MLYNLCKEHRELAYREYGESVSWYEQKRQLVQLKKDHPMFQDVHSQVLQNVTERVDTAFQAFFDGRNDYPNWKSRSDYRSFTYPQEGGFRYQDGEVYLSKIGWVRAFHEDKPPWYDPDTCTPKTCTVREERFGDWWASITFDVPEENVVREPADPGLVGLDAGLTTLATLSDGTKITNPRHLKESQERLAKARRDLSRKERGSNNWHKQRQRVAKLERRAARKRQDHLHKVSRHLAESYTCVAVEGNLAGLTQSEDHAQAVHDAAWGTLFEFLEYKLDEHGGRLVRLEGENQAYSTKDCSECGYRNHDLSLEDRSWTCPDCGAMHDRDINAARNLEQRARTKLQDEGTDVPMDRGESTPLDTRGCKPTQGVGARE